jgi:hypothetical protein
MDPKEAVEDTLRGGGGNMFTQPRHIAGLLTFSYEALEGLAGGESFSRQDGIQ